MVLVLIVGVWLGTIIDKTELSFPKIQIFGLEISRIRETPETSVSSTAEPILPITTAEPVLPTATTTTMIVATATVDLSQNTILIDDIQLTGPSTRKVFNVELKEDNVIIGDAYDFQDSGYHCVVFMIRKVGIVQFSVMDGGWYKYSGITTDVEAEKLLQDRVQYLKTHPFCKNVAFPVERIK